MRREYAAVAVGLCACVCACAVYADESDTAEVVATGEAVPASREGVKWISLDLRARADWQNDWEGSESVDSESGFMGKYLMLRLDGHIAPGLDYSWRQRFNKSSLDGNFFDSTDWLYVQWQPVEDVTLSAGKQVVAIGGWEYDRNPVDLYSCSVFWQNVACYQWGVSGAYRVGPGSLTGQVNQSMFHTPDRRNLYGYNVMYSAGKGMWSGLYSVNLTEYAPGRYINYLSLGNRLEYGEWCLEADFMNRAARHQAFFGKDVTVVAELGWKPAPAWRVHGKFTWDRNATQSYADLYVLAGTDLCMAGGGVEFYPLRKSRTSLRLHADCYHSWGRNANAMDVMQDKTTVLNVGVTWDMNIL